MIRENTAGTTFYERLEDMIQDAPASNFTLDNVDKGQPAVSLEPETVKKGQADHGNLIHVFTFVVKGKRNPKIIPHRAL